MAEKIKFEIYEPAEYEKDLKELIDINSEISNKLRDLNEEIQEKILNNKFEIYIRYENKHGEKLILLEITEISDSDEPMLKIIISDQTDKFEIERMHKIINAVLGKDIL